MARNYKLEYARRLARNTANRQAARGHGRTPEHPERALSDPERFASYWRTHRGRLWELAHEPAGRRRLERLNRERTEAGQAEIELTGSPDKVRKMPGQTDPQEADQWLKNAGIPPSKEYVRIVLDPVDGLVIEILPRTGKRRKRPYKYRSQAGRHSRRKPKGFS